VQKPLWTRKRRMACVAGGGRVRSGGRGGQAVQGSGLWLKRLGRACDVRTLSVRGGLWGAGGSEAGTLNADVSLLSPSGGRLAGPERSRVLPARSSSSPSSSARAVGWGRACPSFPSGRFSFRPLWEQPSRRGPSSGASDKPHHLQLRRDTAKLQSDKRYETWRHTSGWVCAPCQLCSSLLSPRGPYGLLRVF